MRASAALELLEGIATGAVRVGKTYAWTHEAMSPSTRAVLDPEEEVLAWTKYRRYAEPLEPNVRFSPRDGVANSWELRRRRVLMGMFFLFEFRSQDEAVRKLFQASVGRVSLRELMTFCGRRMPHFYFEWAFEVLPLSGKTFGPDALEHFKLSPDHRRTFAKLDEEKQNLLHVRRVMES